MIKVELSPGAILDYDDSFAWYAKRSKRSAMEIGAAIDDISVNHKSCPRFDDIYQYTRLKRYPFFVVFRTEGETAHIVAVAHTSREPGFWKNRDLG